MFCPQCRQEYREGVAACAECGVELVETLRPPDWDQAEWVDLVTVLRSGDESQIRVAQSLLEAEGIPCLLNGAGVQDLVGLGRAGTGLNLALGPVQVQVRVQDEEAARELLSASDLVYPEPEVTTDGNDTGS